MITQEINLATELIRHPERMDRSTIPVLKDAIERYPFYQALYLLLLQNMYKVHDPEFSTYLKKYAVYVADRSVLFDMIEGLNYTIPVQKLEDDGNQEANGDRTFTLIDNFLKGVPENATPTSSAGENAPLGNDYSYFLEQLPDFDSEPESQNEDSEPHIAPKQPIAASNPAPDKTERNPLATTPTPLKAESKPAEITQEKNTETTIDNIPTFDENEFTVSSIRKRLNENDDEIPEVDILQEEEPKNEFFTETMAGIYIKQQKYEQALEIIRAISADNPKKSVYFADQMRYLELLIRINKNKKR